GAHADVGGGYSIHENNISGDEEDRDVSLSGLSLNWMMSRIKAGNHGLIPDHAEVFENSLGYMHDARNGSSMYAFAPRHVILTNRYPMLSRYGRLEVHSSVFERLAQPADVRSELGYDSEWYKLKEFSECFVIGGNGEYIYRDCPLINKVE
ncbi:hypothetical protein, partial [Pseudomonas sp.]|uniref:hypothetical protein n=1 Tax=Pseudomonas sp. TaxID=306 RepID=UPI004054871D